MPVPGFKVKVGEDYYVESCDMKRRRLAPMDQKKLVRVKAGDVFTVPLATDKIGFGQVINGARPVYYMVAFDYYTSCAGGSHPLEQIARSPIILLGNFLDGFIRRGHWRIVGTMAPDMSRVPVPAFKAKVGEDYYVESWDMKNRRLANEVEIALLDFRTDYAPVALEEALKAYYEIVPRPKWYEALTLDHIALRSRVSF